jgi:DHA1 family inner membrane transport protein
MAAVVAGVTTATALGVPLSTLLGQHAGWRVPLAAIGLMGIVALILIARTVPRLGADSGPPLRQRARALRSRPVVVGLTAVILVWSASFTAYTYLVPLLVQRAGADGTGGRDRPPGRRCRRSRRQRPRGWGADRRARTTVAVAATVTAVALIAVLPAFGTVPGAVILLAVWQLASWSFLPAAQATLYTAAGPAGDLVVSFVVSGFNVGVVAGVGLGGIALET